MGLLFVPRSNATKQLHTSRGGRWGAIYRLQKYAGPLLKAYHAMGVSFFGGLFGSTVDHRGTKNLYRMSVYCDLLKSQLVIISLL